MGLFDFFKKKKSQDQESDTESILPNQDENQPKSESQSNPPSIEPRADAPAEAFELIYQYREYVVVFISMMLQGNHSPIAAYENPDKSLTGFLFMAEDKSFNASVEEVIERMETEFEKRMAEGEILSYSIYYHSEFNNDNNHAVAHSASRHRAITVKYKKADGLNGNIAIPYTVNNDELSHRGFSGFTIQQNSQILSVKLNNEKNYFEEIVKLEAEITENEFGIKVKKSNDGTLGNMWGGLMGFGRLEKKNGQIMAEYMAYVISQEPKLSTDDVSVHELAYGPIVFRGIKTLDGQVATVLPVVKSNEIIDTETRMIAEWTHVSSLEAVINAGGRGSFALSYFATDYAINKDIYNLQKELNIAFSGILYALQERNPDENKITPDGPVYSDNFAGYMPNKELGHYGCFDFIGVLEDFKKVAILEDQSVQGYILKMRLITHPDIDNYFTIPLFINKENTEITNFYNGMKLTGLFQLLGYISQ